MTEDTAAEGTAGQQMSGRAYLRLIGFGALIGIPAALVAVLFLAAVTQLQKVLWTNLPDSLGYSSPPWFLVIGLPIVGALIVIIARLFLPGDGGHDPLGELGGGGPVPSINAGSIALAAVGTLGFGLVLGPEAPLIALGSATGLIVALFIKLSKQESTVLATAGSFSAISSLFGGPIVGGILMLEVGIGMGSALIPALIPGFVAAAVGYLIFIGFGDWAGIDTQSLNVSGLPLYEGTHLGDLLLALGVGVFAAVLIVVVRSLATGVAVEGLKRISMPLLLLAGGAVVGLLAQVAVWLGADYNDVLFSGQDSIPSLVAQTSTKIVLVLLVAKGLAYAVSLGAGFRGGPVFPSIFLGVALATLAVVWFGTSPTLAVAVGTAAGVAAMTRLLLTPIVLAALLVGANGLDAVPAAVMAAVAAWLVVNLLDPKTESSASRPNPSAGPAEVLP